MLGRHAQTVLDAVRGLQRSGHHGHLHGFRACANDGQYSRHWSNVMCHELSARSAGQVAVTTVAGVISRYPVETQPWCGSVSPRAVDILHPSPLNSPRTVRSPARTTNPVLLISGMRSGARWRLDCQLESVRLFSRSSILSVAPGT